MKQLSKLRNIATRLAFFAVIAVAMLALSPKAFAATSINIGDTSDPFDPTKGLTVFANTPYDNSNSNGFITAGTLQWDGSNTLTLTNATISNYVKIEGNITIILEGANSITSTDTAKDTVNGALHVTGTTTIQGSGSLTATGAHPQDGIYIGSSSTSSDSADQALTIKTATITATGGTSSANIGRNGISCGSLAIEGASVNGIGGKGITVIGDDRAGGDGISVNDGEIYIENAEINATGGNGNDTGGGGDGLYIALGSASGSATNTISNTTMTLTGGEAPGTSGINNPGSGLSSYHNLTLNNCTINSATGGDTANSVRAGYGIYFLGGTFTLNNTTIKTAKGGAGIKSGTGIHVSGAEELILTNGSTINAIGGDASGVTTNEAWHGVSGAVTLNDTSQLTATGGNATGVAGTTNTAGYGVIGPVTLNGSSKLTATGGNARGGTTNTAGHGVYLGSVEINDTSSITATGGNASGGTTNIAGYGVNLGAVTLNSDDIVLSAIGGTGGNTPAHGLSQVATITPTPTLLDAYVGASGFTTKVDLADSADPLIGIYNQNRYVYISKGAPPTPPTPSYTPPPEQKSARDVIYPINLSLSNYDRYIFNSSGLYSNFTGVWIHGFAIPASYYTLTMESDGTATVQLKDWYVRTLNYGEEYLIHLVFSNGNENGYAVTKFYR